MKRTRTLLLIGLVLSLIIPLSLFVGCKKSESKVTGYTVGVSKLLPHPALDAVEQGLQDYLKTTGLEISYDLQNANGDISTASSIAQKFKSDKVDVAVGIATPSAQALAQAFPHRLHTSDLQRGHRCR